jgi:ParB-like chromosome segregation protein Spo0J
MSLVLDRTVEFEGIEPSLELPLASLRVTEGVRSGGLDEAHVALLMETVEEWPPIVVWGDERLVIDGAHRVEAARRLGRSRISVTRFLGSRDEAFVESVRRNVAHGLPLSVGDRRRAAVQVLHRHPEWSDRRIASLCGLSGKSLARLRREELACSATDGVVVFERRVGRDGKARPVQSGEVRDRIRQALEKNPTGSLRTIAAMAGASPETVRTVKALLEVGPMTSPARSRAASPAVGQSASNGTVISDLPESLDPPIRSRTVSWMPDAALLACGDDGDFARWFAGNRVEEDWHHHVWAIPIGRVYEVVDEARRRAAAWTAFATMLEGRAR